MEREKLEKELEAKCFGFGDWEGLLDCRLIADAILASDWLRDTLAAERERCARVVQKKAEAAHSRAFDLWEARERGHQVTTAELANARGRADWLEQLAEEIRNLGPKESDDARG